MEDLLFHNYYFFNFRIRFLSLGSNGGITTPIGTGKISGPKLSATNWINYVKPTSKILENMSLKMANKMRDKRNKLEEIKGAGVARVNMGWLYPQAVGKFSENHIVYFVFLSTEQKSAIYTNNNQSRNKMGGE